MRSNENILYCTLSFDSREELLGSLMRGGFAADKEAGDESLKQACWACRRYGNGSKAFCSACMPPYLLRVVETDRESLDVKLLRIDRNDRSYAEAVIRGAR